MLGRILASGLVLAAASTAWASQVLTPAGWGGVEGTGAYGAGNMFDSQPTWDGTAPVGGNSNLSEIWATWNPATATAFVDFGADFASIRIEQIWTQGMGWRPSTPFPSPEVWWDNDVASSTLVGPNVAATVNICTKGSTGSNPGIWQQDFDYTSAPITPAARYLKLRIPTQSGNDITAATEVAIIGTVPEPASLGVIAGAAVLMMRRRR